MTSVRPQPNRLVETNRWSSATAHLLGWSLLVVGVGELVSAGVGALAADAEPLPVVVSGLGVAVLGAGLIRATVVPARIRPISAFGTVTVLWVGVCLAGALPFWAGGVFAHWDEAIFESVSGFTASGGTVLSDIEGQGASILFWRQLTQWIGSVGFVVLALSVLPLLGVGGMELLRAETPGPDSDRLAPRVSETARRLSGIYLGLTALASLGFVLVGMNLYDAVGHAMTAIATGGFSPYNNSLGHFDSAAVELVAVAAMFLGAVNFALFFHALRGRDLRVFWRSGEFRFFLAVVVASIAFVSTVLGLDGYGHRAVRDATFNVVSLVSTTGFGTVDFTRWVPSAQIVLLFLMVTGGMAGSTSGALKMFRIRVVLAVAVRELRRVRHPRGVFAVRNDGRPISEAIVSNVVGYVLLYFLVCVAGVVLLAVLGVDLVTGAGSVITSMGGVGPGLAETGPASNFLTVSRPARGVLDVLMVLGRLEIIPVFLAVSSTSRVRRAG